MAMGHVPKLALRIQPQRHRHDRHQQGGQPGLWQVS